MDTPNVPSTQPQPEEHGTAAAPAPDKQPWQEPKLAFVEPRLTRHGGLQEVTGAEPFFGGFTP
ncbi:MAG TPA: hypothetical protein VIH59_34650 [Candidatus Tectomicrobia bacterium]|jgi:hypothetical protein